MTFLYLDTSALVKCYIAEDGSDDVIALMADAAAVATSLVTRTEVAAALAKAVRDDRVDEDEAQPGPDVRGPQHVVAAFAHRPIPWVAATVRRRTQLDRSTTWRRPFSTA